MAASSQAFFFPPPSLTFTLQILASRATPGPQHPAVHSPLPPPLASSYPPPPPIRTMLAYVNGDHHVDFTSDSPSSPPPYNPPPRHYPPPFSVKFYPPQVPKSADEVLTPSIPPPIPEVSLPSTSTRSSFSDSSAKPALLDNKQRAQKALQALEEVEQTLRNLS